MFGRVKKLAKIIKYFFEDEDNLLLHLMEIKVYECVEDCKKLKIGDVEELEDLLFHIKTYYEIPQALIEVKYGDLKGMTISQIVKKCENKRTPVENLSRYLNYLMEVETQRAVERSFIFEHAKILTFGFRV